MFGDRVDPSIMSEFKRSYPDLFQTWQDPIVCMLRGSHTHGTYVPPENELGFDDVDLFGVYIDRRQETYFGCQLSPWSGTDKKIDCLDLASYCLQHYFSLALNCNPNVMSALWTDPGFYLGHSFIWDGVVGNRNLFSSKLAFYSFGGYAFSQLKRMKSAKNDIAECGCSGKFHEECLVNASRGRGSTKRYATGFMGAKRKSLVEKFGYDTKNAAHCVRLLRMGTEFLRTGELVVERPDASELIDIKKGLFSMDQVIALADAEMAKLEAAKDESKLPEAPDRDQANALCVDIVREYVNEV
jgi:hypothetical protein